ncbi:MAG: alpha amylase N-terminal ig-like domain-containing protein [Clostridium sp.]|nr:alpha amylase N-terminal ig-like domain-containing protein [Clostridium sp.]
MERWLDSIYTDGSKYFVSNPLPKKGEEIKIYLRAEKDSPIDTIFLRTKLNGQEELFEMNKEYDDEYLSYYCASIKCYEDMMHYHFYIISDDKKIYYYTQMGIVDYIPDETYDFKILYNYEQPSWVKESVFYQIFPERFCNGNKENDVKSGEYTFDGYEAIKVEDWNSVPKEYDESHCLDFYGGDLEGIREKIPYLKKMGVNAIYINPIFYAATVHKYDCLDYFHVDPHFGGDKAFEELVNDLHENNMKVIIDISINHTGIANKWFNKDGIFFDKSVGAYNNKESKERNYYFFGEGNQYKEWNGVETLPTLNYTCNDLRDIIYKEKDSVIKKWLKSPYKIDGWRFDVADTMARNDLIQLHHEIWPEIRNSIKEENSDAYILAEDWCDVSEFLKGNEWDSAMNYYGCARPVRQFVGENDLFAVRNPKLAQVKTKLTAKNLANRIKEHLCKLPFVIQENQFNLLDSHDVPRLHNNEKISFDNYRAAVIMMFTLIGTPNIYYGDEAGIDGRINSVEGCRYPMCWDKDIENTKYYNLYSTLSNLKIREDALKYGGFKIISEDDYVFAYARFNMEDAFITVCSTDDLIREIRIPAKIFGKSPIIKEEMFGAKLSYEVENGEIILNVEPHQSYLIRL